MATHANSTPASSARPRRLLRSAGLAPHPPLLRPADGQPSLTTGHAPLLRRSPAADGCRFWERDLKCPQQGYTARHAPANLLALLTTRADVERTVEQLIDMLDALDAGDEDREPEFDDDLDEDKERESDAEPSLGATEAIDQNIAWFATCNDTDLELVDEDGSDDEDAPPRDPYAVMRHEAAGGAHV